MGRWSGRGDRFGGGLRIVIWGGNHGRENVVVGGRWSPVGEAAHTCRGRGATWMGRCSDRVGPLLSKISLALSQIFTGRPSEGEAADVRAAVASLLGWAAGAAGGTGLGAV